MTKPLTTKKLTPTQLDVLAEVVERCRTSDERVSKWSVYSMLHYYPGRARGISKDDVQAYLDSLPKPEPECGV